MVEMRMIAANGYVVRRWHHYMDDIMPEAENYADHDVYFGVIPRYATGGSKADDVLAQTTVLWMDLDPKDQRTKALVFRHLSAITPPPQIVVDSGSGYHAYWLLKYPVAWRQAEMVMRGMAAAHGGDRVYDQARILRLPGTLNHKTDPPRPVRILRLDTLAKGYSIGDFVDFIDSGPEDSAPTWLEQFGTSGFARLPSQVALRGDMPRWLIDLLDTDPGKGKRSEHVFHVVACLVELGFDDDTIEEIVQDHPRGVGAKYAEKGASGHRYLSYPLAEARRRVMG